MSDEGFFSRWAQRKGAAKRGEALPEAPVAPPPSAPPPAAEGPVVPADGAVDADVTEPAFDPASLPPLEALTAESDFLPFLARNVPPLLKHAALRRMWSLDIGIRDYVGPADYAWDYNTPGGVPGSSLELFGDLQKHLAQAIGLGPEPPVPEAEDEPASEEAPTLVAEAPVPRLSEPAAPVPDATPPPEPPVATVRRHGGASPV